MQVTIGVSNHHVHLTKEDIEILFGSNYEPTILRCVNQPGQYVCEETVAIKTPKATIEKLRIMGPPREYTQVEISKTDAIKLGVSPPIRDSGDLKNSCPITIVGPNGEITKQEGLVLATRHIHLTKDKAKELGLYNTKEVKVQVSGPKGGIMDHVHIKITDKAYYEMHLDTDDANAHLLTNGSVVEIIK